MTSLSLLLFSVLTPSLSTLATIACADNTPPEIVQGPEMLKLQQSETLTLTLNMFEVNDPDNTVAELSLIIDPSALYTVSGTSFTPVVGLLGLLNVTVRVFDGQAYSASYTLKVTVRPNNTPPVLTAEVNTFLFPEDAVINIDINNLPVYDPDSPELTIVYLGAGGAHYTIQDHSIYPEANYHGPLSVPAKISDGVDSSEAFIIPMILEAVNDAPYIASLPTSVTTDEDRPIPMFPAFFEIVDVDNTADDFSLIVHPGEGYTLRGIDVIPAENYTGSLTIPFQVSDGTDLSEVYELQALFTPVNDAPVLHHALHDFTTPAHTPLVFTLSDFYVTDVDNAFPEDHALILLPGNDYAVQAETLLPRADFTGGTLHAAVQISDGTDSSQVLPITVWVDKVVGTAADPDLDFSLYPNPSPGSFFISWPQAAPAAITIVDSQGRLAYAGQAVTLADEVFRLSLAPGVYVLQARSHQGAVLQRLIIR